LESANRLKQQNENHNQAKSDDPQIPQPDLRFASGNSEATAENTTEPKKRGQSPNKNTHRIDLPLDAVAYPLHHYQKHAKNELCITAVQADMKTLARELTLA